MMSSGRLCVGSAVYAYGAAERESGPDGTWLVGDADGTGFIFVGRGPRGCVYGWYALRYPNEPVNF